MGWLGWSLEISRPEGNWPKELVSSSSSSSSKSRSSSRLACHFASASVGVTSKQQQNILPIMLNFSLIPSFRCSLHQSFRSSQCTVSKLAVSEVGAEVIAPRSPTRVCLLPTSEIYPLLQFHSYAWELEREVLHRCSLEWRVRDSSVLLSGCGCGHMEKSLKRSFLQFDMHKT